VFAVVDRFQNQRSRRFQAPDQFHDDIHFRIGDDRFQVVGQQVFGQIDVSGFIERSYPHPVQGQRLQQRMATVAIAQNLSCSCPDCSQSQQTDFKSHDSNLSLNFAVKPFLHPPPPLLPSEPPRRAKISVKGTNVTFCKYSVGCDPSRVILLI